MTRALLTFCVSFPSSKATVRLLVCFGIFHLPAAALLQQPPMSPIQRQVLQQSRMVDAKAALIAVGAGFWMAFSMSATAAPTMNEAIVESSEATYPILKALPAAGFEEFTSKLGNVFLDIPPEKLSRTLDLGIGVLNSADPDKIAALNTVAEKAFSGLDTGSCDLVPLPPMSLVDKFVKTQVIKP